jgi:Zn-dependent membrane protease YugP
MPFMFFDPSMIIVLPGLLLAMYAQFKVRSTFARYSRIASERGITGAQVARELLRAKGVEVAVERTEGQLTDHYDPREKVLRLSPEVYSGSSIASLGVAAHETGHALQHATGYVPLSIRHTLVPISSFGSMLAFPLFLLGLFIQSTGLLQAGLWLFAAVLLFQVVTLPVEFDASARAITLLEGNGYISRYEVGETKKVLNAAALTYVAAVLVSLLELVRLLVVSGLLGNRDE